MKSWLVFFKVVFITTFINSAARKTNIKNYQLFHRFSRYILHLPFLLMEAHRNFSMYIETIVVSPDIYSTANKYYSVYPETLLVLPRHNSIQRNSSRTSSKHISRGSGNIWKAPAFRRNFIDAMSRVLRYAGRVTETPELSLLFSGSVKNSS